MSSSAIRTVALPFGERIPALGLGTWHMAEDPARRETELAALERGLDLGLTLVDTAEMYGDGAAEELIGDAIAGRRDEVFLVSKVLPSNASHSKTVAACERSLRRLGTDRIDLYLLHWRGFTLLEETVEAFHELVEAEKIRYRGVSNFDVADMEELFGVSPEGPHVQTDQVLCSTTSRAAGSSSTCCPGAARMACRSWIADRAGTAPRERSAAQDPTGTARRRCRWRLRGYSGAMM